MLAPINLSSSKRIVLRAASASSSRQDAASQRTSMSRLPEECTSRSSRSARATHSAEDCRRGTSPTSSRADSRSSKRIGAIFSDGPARCSMAWRSVLCRDIIGSASPSEMAARASSTWPRRSREGARESGRLVSWRTRPPTSSCSISIRAA